MATASIISAHCLLEMNYEKDSPILDLLGDGTIGSILSQNGFTNVDLLIESDDQLKETTSCYRNVIKSEVSADVKLPIESRKYEVVVMARVFRPGGMRISTVEQILRIVKSGGIICWSMADPRSFEDDETAEQYRDGQFDRYIEKLCDKCKWISVLGYPKVLRNYENEGQNGLFYAMQVI